MSAKSKAVVASRRMANVVSVVGSQGICLPCPSLTEPEALKLFLQNTGCAQPSMKWTNEEKEILKSCIELSFFEDDLDSGSCRRLRDGPDHNSLVPGSSSSATETDEALPLETEEEMDILRKCIELSLSMNESDSSPTFDSRERRGHYNPLVLVAMGSTIKEHYALESMQLMEKCQRIKFLPQHVHRRSLSDILRTKRDDLSADEEVLFLDVALLYTVTNLGDVEFVDVLDHLLKWLETVDGSPRSEILVKLKNLNDLKVSTLKDHRKEHELLYNIYEVLSLEGESRNFPGNCMSALPFFNEAVELLELHNVSIEAKADLALGRMTQFHGTLYLSRARARINCRDFSGGTEDLVKADEYFPNHAYILQLLGMMKAGAGQLHEGLELLNRAIALYPTTETGIAHARNFYADAFAARSVVKCKLHDTGGARLDLNFARQLGSDLPVDEASHNISWWVKPQSLLCYGSDVVQLWDVRLLHC